MKLKVNHEDLEIVSGEINASSVEFLDVLKLWSDSIEQLSSVWQGDDAVEFYANIGIYLEHMKKVPIFYNEIATFIKEANREYRKTDLESKNEFSSSLMGESKNV